MLIQANPVHLDCIKQSIHHWLPGVIVWAFGSRVIGNAKEFSDLDLVIHSDHPISLEILGQLKHELSESDLPFKVDLVDWSLLSKEFRDQILQKYTVL